MKIFQEQQKNSWLRFKKIYTLLLQATVYEEEGVAPTPLKL